MKGIICLKNLILDVEKILSRDFEKKEILNILQQYNRNDCKEYIQFEEDGYKRNFVKKWDLFDVIVICWNQWSRTPVHGHPSEWCYVKILEWNIKETLYSKDNQVMKNKNHYKWDLLYSHDSIWFHTLENTSVEDVISLHIYAPGNYLPN